MAPIRHGAVIAKVVSRLAAVVLAAMVGPVHPVDDPLVVTITIRHSRFVPDTVHVPANTTVRFAVVNDDPIDHELLLGDAQTQDRHEAGTEATHGDRRGEVSIAPYTTTSTTYRFGAARTMLLGCHLPGHWDYGMRGTVVVGRG